MAQVFLNQSLSRSLRRNKKFLIWCNNSARSLSSSGNGGRDAKSDHNFCVDLVKTRDKDGYLCGLLQSHEMKEAYFALRAFNVELASVKDNSNLSSATSSADGSSSSSATMEYFSDPNVNSLAGEGLLRATTLKVNWWRTAIADLYNGEKDILNPAALHHPVVRSLGEANKKYGFTKRYLEKMIDARETEMQIDQFDSLQDLIHYGEDTSACLNSLILECYTSTSKDEDWLDTADDAAYHIGIAQTIVTSLKSTPYLAMKRSLSIPSDLMKKYSIPSTVLLTPDKYVEQTESGSERYTEEFQNVYLPALQNAVREMAFVAKSHFDVARDLQGKIKDSRARVNAIAYPAVGVDLYLNKLDQVANYNILDSSLYLQTGGFGKNSQVWYPLLLGRAWVTGVF